MNVTVPKGSFFASSVSLHWQVCVDHSAIFLVIYLILVLVPVFLSTEDELRGCKVRVQGGRARYRHSLLPPC